MTADLTVPPGDVLTLWVVFNKPQDFPTKFVLRPQFVVSGVGEPVISSEVWLRDTLAEIRELIPPGLHRMRRQRGDPPHIVETWL